MQDNFPTVINSEFGNVVIYLFLKERLQHSKFLFQKKIHFFIINFHFFSHSQWLVMLINKHKVSHVHVFVLL